MGDLLLVTGGARSGKSRFAEQRAAQCGRPVVYIATLEPGDEEMIARIARHRAGRPANWTTIEAPHALVPAIDAALSAACVLVDCLSVWVANRLLDLGDAPEGHPLDELEAALDAEIDALAAIAAWRDGPTIVVTNEVGSSVVPPSPLGRAYRDLLGRANQRVSSAATRAWLVVAGRPLELPPPLG